MRPLISFAIFSGLVGLIDCSSRERLAADARQCNLVPWSERLDAVFDNVESKFAMQNVAMADVEGQYKFLADVIEYCKTNYFRRYELRGMFTDSNSLSPTYEVLMAILEQLYLTNELDYRECLDHCTYVLARINCEAGKYQHACFPRSRKVSYIKSMIDTKVFPLIERCQIFMATRALELNNTVIEPQMYSSISLIAEAMTSYQPTRRFKTIEEMFLRSRKPYFLIRRSLSPTRSGFLDNIFHIMYQLEELSGNGDVLRKLIDSKTIYPNGAKSHYELLILNPCRYYIEIMHTAMDPITFYGKILDLDRSNFTSAQVPDEVKIEFYRLVLLYEACVVIDNGDYYPDWRKAISDLRRHG